MIFDELNTGFRWYTSLSRQNRYKNQCASLCDFALLSLCNDLLPFQIKTPAFGNANSWQLIYLDGEISIDISACIPFINKYVAPDSSVYLSYNGGSLSGCIPDRLNCGHWYSTLSDDDGHIFYSEVFNVLPIEGAEEVFPSLDPSLFSAWRFYDDINKQTRYKNSCDANCNFYLKTDKAALLPFEFRDISIGNVQQFKLIGINEDCEFLIDTTLIEKVSYSGFDYLRYKGDAIANLPCGKFYAIVSDETNTWYSELIEILDIQSLSEIDYLNTDTPEVLTTDGGIGLMVD